MRGKALLEIDNAGLILLKYCSFVNRRFDMSNDWFHSYCTKGNDEDIYDLLDEAIAIQEEMEDYLSYDEDEDEIDFEDY